MINLVAFSSELLRLWRQLMLFALVQIQVSSQLPNQLSIFSIVCLRLEGLVFKQKIWGLLSWLLSQILHLFLKLMSLHFELHFEDIELAFDFVVLFTGSLHFGLFGFQFNSMSRLDVLLNFHSHNVCVHRQRHLVCHWVNFSLLLLNSASHVVQTLLQSNFKPLFALDFFAKAFLILGRLCAHLLIVTLEIVVKRIYLLFFGEGSFQMSFDGLESPLEIFVFLADLVENGAARSAILWSSLLFHNLLLSLGWFIFGVFVFFWNWIYLSEWISIGRRNVAPAFIYFWAQISIESNLNLSKIQPNKQGH